jgi:hypothetical protein
MGNAGLQFIQSVPLNCRFCAAECVDNSMCLVHLARSVAAFDAFRGIDHARVLPQNRQTPLHEDKRSRVD